MQAGNEKRGLPPSDFRLMMGLFRCVGPAIAVDMGRAQGARAMAVERHLPGIQLFLREGITLTGRLIAEDAVLYRLDNGEFSGFYPALCVWRWEERDLRTVFLSGIGHDGTRYFFTI